MFTISAQLKFSSFSLGSCIQNNWWETPPPLHRNPSDPFLNLELNQNFAVDDILKCKQEKEKSHTQHIFHFFAHN